MASLGNTKLETYFSLRQQEKLNNNNKTKHNTNIQYGSSEKK
jgi:hypothetical protein